MTSPSSTKQPSIAEVFDGKCIFITGASRIIGQTLLEKILRCCPGVEHVYVLLKSKNNVNYREALDRLLKGKLFDRVRRECPTSLFKVIPVCGNVNESGLYLDDCNTKILQAEVNFIFHCSIVIRYDECIKTALTVNLLATSNVLELALSMKNLKAFIHVSTAYSFCNWGEIQEKLYPEIATPMGMFALMGWMSDDQMERVCKMINMRGNVYFFAAAMAELYLNEYKDNIPLSIVRPSIVTATWKEPFPGWSDGLIGPGGMLLAWQKGIIKSMYAKKAMRAEFVPADIVANTLIVAASEIVVKRSPHPLIVNCTNPSRNPLLWADVERICYPLFLKYPTNGLYRYPGGSLKNYRITHRIAVIFQHWITAGLLDVVALPFSNTSTVATYRQIHSLLRGSEIFMTHQFVFLDDNLRRLHSEMSESDREVFSLDMESLDWDLYFEHYILGLRRYVMKESDSDLPAARQRMSWTYQMWLAIHSTWLLTSFSIFTLIYPNRIGFAVRDAVGSQVKSTCTNLVRLLLQLTNLFVRK